MRQDLIYIHPDDFERGFAMFKYYFDIWIEGYQKWGDGDFAVTFVKDPTVPQGLMMYCKNGDRVFSTPVEIISIS